MEPAAALLAAALEVPLDGLEVPPLAAAAELPSLEAPEVVAAAEPSVPEEPAAVAAPEEEPAAELLALLAASDFCLLCEPLAALPLPSSASVVLVLAAAELLDFGALLDLLDLLPDAAADDEPF